MRRLDLRFFFSELRADRDEFGREVVGGAELRGLLFVLLGVLGLRLGVLRLDLLLGVPCLLLGLLGLRALPRLLELRSRFFPFRFGVLSRDPFRELLRDPPRELGPWVRKSWLTRDCLSPPVAEDTVGVPGREDEREVGRERGRDDELEGGRELSLLWEDAGRVK